MKNAIKRHYHWVILAVLFSEMIIYGGIGNALGVFTIPITEGLGIGRGAYALTGSVQSLVGAASTMLAAVLFRRFGYRRSAIFSLGICALSYALRGLSGNFWVFLFSRAIYGVAVGALDTTGAVRTVDSWFHKHKGLILGAVSMATGLGGSIMSILLTAIITRWGWRTACFVLSGFFVFLILLYLLVRDKPEDMGLEPYGEREMPKKKEKVHPSHENWHGRTMKELLHMPHFYLMAACTFFSIFFAKMVFVSTIPHFQDIGFSAAEAAAFNSVMMLGLAAAKLGCGELCDIIGAKKVAIICMVCLVISQVLMGMVSSTWVAYLSMVILAVGLVMWTIMVPLLTRPLFGYAPSDSLIGLFLGLVTLSGMFAEPVINYFYDFLGSYRPVYYIGAALTVVVTVMYFVLFKVCDKDKERYLMEEELAHGTKQ